MRTLFLFTCFLQLQLDVFCRNVFTPIKDESTANNLEHFYLKDLNFPPYRIQFKGIIEWGNKTKKYTFLIDKTELIHIKIAEKSSYGFILLNYNKDTQCVRIKDTLLNEEFDLPIYKQFYRENSFVATLVDKNTNEMYIFNERNDTLQISRSLKLTVRPYNLAKNKMLAIEDISNECTYAYKLTLKQP